MYSSTHKHSCDIAATTDTNTSDSDDEDEVSDIDESDNWGVRMSESARWLATELQTKREVGRVSSPAERRYFNENYGKFQAADVGKDANGYSFINWDAFARSWNVECDRQDDTPGAAKLDMTLKTSALLQQYWQEHLQSTNETLTMEPIRMAVKVCGSARVKRVSLCVPH